MKKLTKWLALLLAGVLTLSSLVACDANGDSDDTQEDSREDDETSAVDDDFAEYCNLSPEEVYEALCSADEVSYKVERTESRSGSIAIVYLIRDGEKVRYEVTLGDETDLCYLDLSKHTTYLQTDGIWECGVNEDVTWNDLHMREKDPLFEDDHYSKTGDQYKFTEKASGEYDWKEITMTSKGTTYIFELVSDIRTEDENAIAIMTIQFEDMEVELPEINDSVA